MLINVRAAPCSEKTKPAYRHRPVSAAAVEMIRACFAESKHLAAIESTMKFLVYQSILEPNVRAAKAGPKLGHATWSQAEQQIYGWVAKKEKSHWKEKHINLYSSEPCYCKPAKTVLFKLSVIKLLYKQNNPYYFYEKHTQGYNPLLTLNEHICPSMGIRTQPHLIWMFLPSLTVAPSLRSSTPFIPAPRSIGPLLFLPSREEQRSLKPKVWMCLSERENLLSAEQGCEWWHVSGVLHYERDFVVCDCLAVCV